MSTFKRAQVVMLPTEEANAPIQIRSNKGYIHPRYPEGFMAFIPEKLRGISDSERYWINQHLYILSDEEIKEGDWCIDDDFIGQVKDYDNNQNSFDCWIGDSLNGYATHYDNCKKIIATTDKSLQNRVEWTDQYTAKERSYSIEGLPSILESFIQEYIKAYNEGKPITEVDLEVEMETSGDTFKVPVNFIIKTRSDNTVIVHQSKMYTKDEVEALCLKAWSAGVDVEKDLRKYGEYTPFSKWVKDNL